MTSETICFVGGQIFDGVELHSDHCSVFIDGVCTDLVPDNASSRRGEVFNLNGDILSVGYTDLQVNGGGGVMLNDDPNPEILVTMAEAHRKLGTTCLLPTLISDTPAKTRAAIDAVKQAIDSNIPGIAGLHLEGPHLSQVKKGAHDDELIRPMDNEDLELLLKAANDLPCLMVTVAPENTTMSQVKSLAESGAVVALGHTDASYDTCVDYHNAGVRCVTHLYNAMSQLGSREPGLTGTAIDCAELYIGLIADGIHVHPASIRAAWNGKTTAERFYLVSDAMGPAGTDQQSFTLNGRSIYRRDGRLTLDDGTLAGADLNITSAIRFMHNQVGIELAAALRMATTVPKSILSRSVGLCGTALSDIIRISADLQSVTPIVAQLDC